MDDRARSTATTLDADRRDDRRRPPRRTRTVFAYDPTLAGPVRVGGDDLHVGTYVTDLMTIAGSTITPHRRQDAGPTAASRLGQTGRHPRRRRRLHRHRRQRLDAHADRRRAARPARASLTTVTIVPTGVLGGPNSPLVLYGDTSQDGLWYSGNPATVDGYEFGDKPFNPFTTVPDAENEDDEWVFPLGNPFRLAGNDVIDAQRAVRRT